MAPKRVDKHVCPFVRLALRWIKLLIMQLEVRLVWTNCSDQDLVDARLVRLTAPT